MSPGSSCSGQVVIQNKRKSDRQRLFLRGFIRIPQSNLTIDCIVRDLSETGAKLRFRCAPQITEFFELHIPAKGQIVQSRLVWIDDCEVGTSFESFVASDSSSGNSELSLRMARLENEITALKNMLRELQALVDTRAA
jgi:predicted ester cyclase